MKQRITERALRISTIYAIVTAIWIILSDRLIGLVTRDFDDQTLLQTGKGLLFISLTAGLIYILLRRELKRQEQTLNALHESEARYRRLAENARDLIYRYRLLPTRGFEYVNPAALTVTGYTPDDHYTDPDLGLKMVHPDDRVMLEQAAVGDMIDRLLTLRWVRKDGTIIWTEQRNVPIYDDAGQVVALEGIARDITQQKLAEVALRNSRERYRYLVDVSPVAIFINRGDQIEFTNPAGLTLFGATKPEQIIGKSPYDIFHPDFHGTLRERIRRLVEDRDAIPLLEERIVRLDGTVRDVEVMATPFTDHMGNAVQFVLHDITGRKKAEEELKRYREKLEDMVEQRTAELEAAYAELQVLSQAKDEFVSNVSHELKSPITTLKLRHHLLRNSPEQLEKHLSVLERETARLNRTIDDLLRLSRLDQGRLDFVPQSLDVNRLVRHLVMDRTLQAEQKELALAFSASGDLPSIVADPGLLEQVISILLTNAINYTPATGRITVATQHMRDDAGLWVGISVVDTGLGILPDEQPHLFERFFQGHANEQADVPGTGLGLAIAKEIIDRHRGRIDVESTGMPGEGTTFTVWLPVSPAPQRGEGETG